jgi:hypothetical protein
VVEDFLIPPRPLRERIKGEGEFKYTLPLKKGDTEGFFHYLKKIFTRKKI